MIYRIIFFSFGVACILGAPTDVASSDKQQPTVIPIISQSEELELNGTYKFSYETGNGIKREETSYDKVLPKASGRSHSSEEGGDSNESDESNEIHVQRGSYSYTAPDGTLITVRYIADENGFRPVGSHLPKAPSPISPSFNTKSGRTLKHLDSTSSESAQSVNVNSEQLVPAVASRSAGDLKLAEEKQVETTSVTSSGEELKTTPTISSSNKASGVVTATDTQSEQEPEATESTIALSTKANEISEHESGSGSTPESNKISEGTLKQLDSASSESAKSINVTSDSEETLPAVASSSAAEPKPDEYKPTENMLDATSKDEEPKTTETTLPSGKSSHILHIHSVTPFQLGPKTETTETTITSTQPNELILESQSDSTASPISETDDSEEKMELSTQAAIEDHSSVTTDYTQSVPDVSNETLGTTLSDNTKTDADVLTTTAIIDKEETTRSVITEALTEEATIFPSTTESSSEEVSTSSSST